MIGLSYRMLRTEDSTELPALGSNVVFDFIRTNADCTDRYWALTKPDLLKTDSASTPNLDQDWDTDGLDSSPDGSLSFAVIGNDSRADSGRNKLFVTNDTDIMVLNDTGNSQWTGNWWTGKHSQPPLDSSDSIHAIAYLPLRKIGLVGDGNKIHTISRPSDTQNDTVTYARLTLPSQYRVKHIFPTSQRAWILCDNKFGGDGVVIAWDGFSQTYNEIHRGYSPTLLSGVNFAEVPIVVNGDGVILEYTGNGFSSMKRSGQVIGFPPQSYPRIVPHGMVRGDNGLIYMNVGNQNQSFRNSSGIWCLDPDMGKFYNKHTLAAADTSSNNTDYGQQRTDSVGALYWASGFDVPLAAGGMIYDSATSKKGGIWRIEDPLNETVVVGRGYFVTQYVPADAVKEFWDTIWVRFKRFLTSGNSIVVKAKGTRSLVDFASRSLEATITWTSTTTFTTTLNSTDDSLAVGDEVEVLRGKNSGHLVHISSIVGNHGALQTITVDEAVTTASGSAKACFDRWKKLETITDSSAHEKVANIGIDSSFIQFKVEMRGPAREMEVSDLVVTSESSLDIQS